MDEVSEQISEQLEWRAEEAGIGQYEFHGTVGYDVDIQAVLVTRYVTIQFENDEFEMIPVRESHSDEIYLGDSSHYVGWVASLIKVEYKDKAYHAEYELEQDSY